MGKYKINSNKKSVKSLQLSSKKLLKSLTTNSKILLKNFKKSQPYQWLDPRSYKDFERTIHSVGLLVMAGLILFSSISPLVDIYINHKYYLLNSSTSGLVGSVSDTLAKQITYDSTKAAYVFNTAGMTPSTETVGPDKVPLALLQAKVAGNNSKSKSTYSAVMPTDPKQGISYYDSNTGLSFQLVPNFTEMGAEQVANHIVYPTSDNAQLIYSVKNNGLKEDIVLKQYVSDSLSLSYSLKLPQTLEARMLTDGSGDLGIYSADPALFTHSTYGADYDPAKIESAQLHAKKDHLVFAIPAPVIKQTGQSGQGNATADFALSNDGSTLTVSANHLKGLHYPVSVDPTVVITSTSDFSIGNNEDNNITYPANQINRGGLTGGSISGGWTATTGLPASNQEFATVAYNGFIYNIGGWNGSAATANVYYAPFNPNGTIGSWTATTVIPVATYDHTSVAYNGYLYVIGGGNGSVVATVYYAPINANGSIGTWNTTTALPTATRFATSVAYNGYIYEIGGFNGTAAVTTVSFAPINANGTIGSWTATTALPVATYAANSVVYNGYVYLLGGLSPSVTNVVDYAPINANGTIGSWAAATSLPVAVWSASAVVYNGYIYSMGGYNGSTGVTTINYTPINANGTIGTWSATVVLPGAAYYGSATVYNGYIYFLGGYSSKAFSYTGGVQSYTAPAGTTSITVDMAGAQGGNTNGGMGGRVQANVPVTGGSTYDIYVGGQGGAQSSGGSLPAANPGYPNGGSGGAAEDTTAPVYMRGLGGGGSSDIRPSAGAITAALVIAGAGGGGGVGCAPVPAGGAGGGTTAVAGGLSTYQGATGGGAGTPSSGGIAGTNSSTPNFSVPVAGSQGNGGAGGGIQTTGNNPGQGGGGGGGWYGGGGGGGDSACAAGAGGGGGSSYTSAGVTGVTHTQGYRSGNGYVNISSAASSVNYAKIDPAGVTTAYATTTALPSTTNMASSVAYNGYVYEIAGNNPSTSTTVLYAPINSNGTIGSWTATTALPTAAYGATAVAYNGYLYEIGGYNAGYVATVYYAPISTNGTVGSWTATTALPTGNFDATSIVYNGYLYVIGGQNGTGEISTVYYAPINTNGTIGSWTATTSLPGNRNAATSVVYNGYIYEISGRAAGTYYPNVYYAPINSNGTIGAWTATTSLPTGLAGATAVVYNGYIYEIGGLDATLHYSNVNYAPINSNGTVGSWTATAALPNITAWATSVVYNGYVYEIGGDTGTVSLSNVYYASINNGGTGAVGAWTATTVLPTATYAATSAVYNGYLYEIGGIITGGTYVTTVSYAPINANGTIGAWAATTSLPITTGYATSVAYNGYIYEIGGSNGTTNVSTVYYAPINTNGTIGAWTATTSLPAATYNATSVAYNGYLYEIGGYTTTYVTTASYAPINANGTIGAWTATTSLPVATGAATSVAYNGYVYEISGASPTSLYTVLYAPLNSNGTIGSWTATTSLPVPPTQATSVAYNGYLYEFGGVNMATTYYAPINANGTIGTWTPTTVLPTVNGYAAAVAYNGYVYQVGGCSGSCAIATVNYAPLNVMPRVGHYSSLFSLNSPITPVSITYNGKLPNAYGLSPIQYRTAGSNGVFGANQLSTVMNGSATSCTPGSAQYVEAVLTLDDSGSAAFPDISSTSANVTDFTLTYSTAHALPNLRLRGGKFFFNNALQPLDTCIQVPNAPTIGTATAGNMSATVTFTDNAVGDSPITSHTVTAYPGGFTGTGSSPVTVSGLTNGVNYTFTVTATNAGGTSAPSAVSNSITPGSIVTGGTLTADATYYYRTFTSSGTLGVSGAPLTADVLVIGGGGGGGKGTPGVTYAGGGGGGGFQYYPSLSLISKSYAVTVGAGGIGQSVAATTGGNGGASTFEGQTSAGGGLGGTAAGTGGTSGSPQSLVGGTHSGIIGTGGGGAGSAGSSTTGGTGLYSSISGSSIGYSGGGGGGTDFVSGTATEGGGTGAANSVQPQSGAPNSGGGGGGMRGDDAYTSGSGGSGIVIVRYLRTAVAFAVDYLAVGGGGSGGYSSISGGGGAGGLLTGTGLTIMPQQIYSVTVGAGGIGGTAANNGGNSIFSSITATGGGKGGQYAGIAGSSGGSGGGAGAPQGAGPIAGGSGTAGQGYAGGTAPTSGTGFAAGGGGGAAGVGGNGVTDTSSGNGGSGVSSSITGASVFYAAGGGGAADTTGVGGTGGNGGGGAGGVSRGSTGGSGSINGANATANTGSGGGGSAVGGNAGAGGSGIVVIRYPNTYPDASATTGSPTYTNIGGYKIYKFTVSGTITF